MSQPYAPPPQPMGQLVLNLRKPAGLLSSAMISPLVTIDGYPAPVQWGQNAFPVVPGQHQLQVSSNYMWKYGTADLPVVIQPGQSVEVHYSGPLVTFVRGNIGLQEQPRPGMGVFWAILGVPIVILLLVIILIATNN